MRILLLADIHANWPALQAIQEPHDVCVCLGDLVDYGLEPAPCIDWVRRNAHHVVRGNHDHAVAQDVHVTGRTGFKYLTGVTRPLTRQRLGEGDLRYPARTPCASFWIAACPTKPRRCSPRCIAPESTDKQQAVSSRQSAVSSWRSAVGSKLWKYNRSCRLLTAYCRLPTAYCNGGTMSAAPAANFVEQVEIQGHIIDSLILPKVLYEILTRAGSYVIKDIKIGQRRNDPSQARIEVRAPSA